MELNREQIVKALEFCTRIKKLDACANCPAHLGCNDCVDFLREESLALIKELIDSEDYWKRQTFNACMDKGRLDDKIKELTEENEFHRKTISKNAQMALNVTVDEIEKAKADAVRKMQEKIRAKSEYGTINISPWQLDQIVKEMLED